nr:hypothetical protein [Tanacetum cinerariifolium]GEZ17644.1 hypothetical protein [Tanacetum cinerariifolium]
LEMRVYWELVVELAGNMGRDKQCMFKLGLREKEKLGGVRHRVSWMEFILGMGLHTDEEIESVGFGDFLGIALSYTLIKDLMRRLCHRLIACSITERSQSPEKICEELNDTGLGYPQEPQAPLVFGPARTMAQRLARPEEDVHGMREALGEQREVLDSMACDFSRFTTWTVTGLS